MAEFNEMNAKTVIRELPDGTVAVCAVAHDNKGNLLYDIVMKTIEAPQAVEAPTGTDEEPKGEPEGADEEPEAGQPGRTGLFGRNRG